LALRSALIGLLIGILSCSARPLPPEVEIAKKQELDLWRAGAPFYAPSEYSQYKASLEDIKSLLVKEEAKLRWFRKYDTLQGQYRRALEEGSRILKLVQERKRQKAQVVSLSISESRQKISNIARLSSLINEGSLARRNLTKADILVRESEILFEKGDYIGAEARLSEVPNLLDSAEDSVSPILNRFTNAEHLQMWLKWAQETIEQSRATNDYAIVVSKADRTLILYKAGRAVKTYRVGLGRNGSLDKLHAGDGATPEGKYYITKKIPKSKYYKALLINYPNSEDKKRFEEAKRKGLIPRNISIGGLVEIHGGGQDSMTYGCISLDNDKMAELYNIVDVGTPITIVGAIGHNNEIAKALGR